MKNEKKVKRKILLYSKLEEKLHMKSKTTLKMSLLFFE